MSGELPKMTATIRVSLTGPKAGSPRQGHSIRPCGRGYPSVAEAPRRQCAANQFRARSEPKFVCAAGAIGFDRLVVEEEQPSCRVRGEDAGFRPIGSGRVSCVDREGRECSRQEDRRAVLGSGEPGSHTGCAERSRPLTTGKGGEGGLSRSVGTNSGGAQDAARVDSWGFWWLLASYP